MNECRRFSGEGLPEQCPAASAAELRTSLVLSLVRSGCHDFRAPYQFVDFAEACYSSFRVSRVMIENPRIPLTSIHRIEADGVSVFYRQAGSVDSPVVLLLHGFPTSSFQYRELIPRLADRYRVIAPDLPGFGFTIVPEERRYGYTFDSLAETMLAFTDALNLTKYAMYIFDYGAPTGLR